MIATEAVEILEAFIGQFYDDKPAPALVLVNEISSAALLADALSLRSGSKVSLPTQRTTSRRLWIWPAKMRAKRCAPCRESDNQRRLLENVAETFNLEAPPQRIEVFDNSHLQEPTKSAA